MQRGLTRPAPAAAPPPAAGFPPAVSSASVPSPQADAQGAAVTLARPLRLRGSLPSVGRTRVRLRALSFVVLVVIPIAAAAVYYFAIAADQYVAEFRFTLSAAEPPRLDPLALLAGNTAQSPAAAESQILVQYISSRAIVDRIDTSLDIRRLFSRPAADWWARLPRSAPIEELVRYWRGQVDPFYDPANGTVTVRVRAFTPADSLAVAKAIVAACETLVNDLSLRARRDMLRHAEADVAQAEGRLKSALAQIRSFRDREGLIDPAKAAEANIVLATRLRQELIAAEAKLATLKTYMREDAPTVKVLRARIRSLEVQQRALARQMTDPKEARSGTLSQALGSYEALESERKFAEAAYQHALQVLDQSRADADRRHVFVASFIPPSLPQEALYPRRWRALGTVALIAFALWGIGGLVVQSVRDHLV